MGSTNQTPANIFQSLFLNHRSCYKNYTDVYTDGSKIGDLVGCSVVCNNHSRSYRLPPSFSIFSAEFVAIEIALNFISIHPHRQFIIYTDSKSVLDSLQSLSCSPTFISVLNLYNDLSKKGYHILFCWVPGHVGIVGNEIADKAAKQALNPLDLNTPYPDIKHIIKNHIRNKWQEDWNKQINNKLYAVKPHITCWPSTIPRKTDVLITRLRIGHSRLTHRHLLLGEPEPMCPYCFFSHLTIRHVLTDCCGLRHFYRYYFKTSTPLLINLVGEMPHRALTHFLKETGFCQNIQFYFSLIKFFCFYNF